MEGTRKPPSRLTGSITDVPGIQVGHATVRGGGSGCTVLLGPFRGAVDLGGAGTGSRELETLRPRHKVPQVDALLLTGGSAFGLSAASGVMAWLEEQGRGHPTPAGPVPIVPAAVIYDLAPERGRPGLEEGYAAAESGRRGSVQRGRVGAGAGATVGKFLGIERASLGGLGTASRRMGQWRVGALAVVNALGNVLGRDGVVVAGAQGEDGCFLSLEPETGSGADMGGWDQSKVAEIPEGNTTLAVVATDVPLTQPALGMLARMASAALSRRIAPVFTPFDGDLTFALSTGMVDGGFTSPAAFPQERLLRLGVVAREALEDAILDAVSEASTAGVRK